MPVDILYSSIRPLESRRLIERAVTEAIGNRSDRWKAWLDQGDGEPGFSIRIDGPDGAGYSWRFLKPDQISPEFVRAEIQAGLRQFRTTRKS